FGYPIEGDPSETHDFIERVGDGADVFLPSAGRIGQPGVGATAANGPVAAVGQFKGIERIKNIDADLAVGGARVQNDVTIGNFIGQADGRGVRAGKAEVSFAS